MPRQTDKVYEIIDSIVNGQHKQAREQYKESDLKPFVIYIELKNNFDNETENKVMKALFA